MKSLQHLCLGIVVSFGCVLLGQAGITSKQIEDLALKIELGKKLSDPDVRILNRIKKKNPTLLSQSVWSELASARIIARGINSSNPNARKKNTAEKLRSFIVQDSDTTMHDVNVRPGLIALVEQFTQALDHVDYAQIDTEQEAHLSRIKEDLNQNNDSDIKHQVLHIAIEYGIANLVELLISTGTSVTQSDLENLETVENMEHDGESAWFNVGADFARCKELLKPAFIS